MRYRQVKVIAGKGAAADRFGEALRGIAVDRAGLLYAVGDAEVKVFDEAGKLQRRWATSGPGYAVALDADTTVYVGQAGLVEQFDKTGRRLGGWQDGARLGLVTAIGFAGDHVLIADAKDRCLRRLDRQGRWQNNIGKDNNTRGFIIPNGHLDMEVDARETIYVAHSGKHRVERYGPGGELLGHFGKFGPHPEDFSGCCNPTNLALAAHGNVVVTEKAPPRVKVYDGAGKPLVMIGPEAFDANCKNMDVAVDARGRIYVVDTVRLHICVLADEDAGHTAATIPARAPAESHP